MYNHPYFNHPYYKCIVEPRSAAYAMHPDYNPDMDTSSPTPAIVPPSAPMPITPPIHPGPIDQYGADTSAVFSFRPNYRPDVLIPNHTIWQNSDDLFMDIIAEEFVQYKRVDGYYVDVDSRICRHNTVNNKGLIAADVLQSTEQTDADHLNFKCAPAIIVNTENAGFRYVRKDPNGNVLYDIGPVTDACIVGNIDRPEGLYVPFGNARAMADAIIILDNRLAKFEGIAGVSELVANEIIAKPKQLPESHECKCGGNCKCTNPDDFDL